MRVVIAPDSFGGTLTAPEAAAQIRAGWRAVRPADDLVVVPMSDGGEGLLDVLPGEDREVEVSDALGLPRVARWRVLSDGTAVVEAAEANGLRWVPERRRDPLRATSWGVGQLLDAARADGASRVLVGLGGSATIDGGAGALSALGLRLRATDGQGLKVGGGELAGIARIERGWLDRGWADVEVTVLADVRTTLLQAAAVYGPQKGADRDAVVALGAGLQRFAAVAADDLPVAGISLRGAGAVADLVDLPGSGAAGGLGFGLAAGLGAALVDGAAAVARMVGLADRVASADVVVTGEGRLDPSSLDGKVVGHVADLAEDAGARLALVVGQVAHGRPGPGSRLSSVTIVTASPDQQLPEEPAAAVRAAAQRLAGTLR